jgi:guanylate kinase
MGSRGRLFVLSGHSGAGKDSVRDMLRDWGAPLHFVVTVTTRPRRADEVDGVHYHFLTDEEFDRLERKDGLIEKAIVYGQRKGAALGDRGALAEGRDVLARVTSRAR